MNGFAETPAGRIPRVSETLTRRDAWGAARVRLGIGRARYRVPPGIYAIGSPTPESDVLVTANYKLSFDHLRSRLDGRHAWIVVLDTKGVNVWCSAGKGTFGTDELIRRIEAVGLGEIVTHRTLILPQLSATGVSAHRVRTLSGWRVLFGPVRAADLPAYLDAGRRATPEMRRVRFTFKNRIELVPVELAQSARYLVIAAAAFLLLSGVRAGGYDIDGMRTAGLRSVISLVTAYLAGGALVPALLPYIPGRAFSTKGALVGAAAMLALILSSFPGAGTLDSWVDSGAWLLIGGAVSSFMAMNFTGASTYTSLSGVRREMRFAVPAQIACAALGLIAWIAGRFV